jgi:hypothetical protein
MKPCDYDKDIKGHIVLCVGCGTDKGFKITRKGRQNRLKIGHSARAAKWPYIINTSNPAIVYIPHCLPRLRVVHVTVNFKNLW